MHIMRLFTFYWYRFIKFFAPHKFCTLYWKIAIIAFHILVSFVFACIFGPRCTKRSYHKNSGRATLPIHNESPAIIFYHNIVDSYNGANSNCVHITLGLHLIFRVAQIVLCLYEMACVPYLLYTYSYYVVMRLKYKIFNGFASIMAIEWKNNNFLK